jgi:hypothetical protein
MPESLDALFRRLTALESDVCYQEYATETEPNFAYGTAEFHVI